MIIISSDIMLNKTPDMSKLAVVFKDAIKNTLIISYSHRYIAESLNGESCH